MYSGEEALHTWGAEMPKGHNAGEYAQKLGKILGGGGGGSQTFAQASGIYPEKLDEAIGSVVEIVRQKQEELEGRDGV